MVPHREEVVVMAVSVVVRGHFRKLEFVNPMKDVLQTQLEI